MSGFWDKKSLQTNGQDYSADAIPYSQFTPEMVLDEQVLAEIQGDSEDVFDDEEQDNLELMADANLRLEQGRLYQMVLANDIFGETDADPRAIRNVQRQIRKCARDHMEIMLGIKQEQILQAPIVSSPFNDLEVKALKMLASKLSGGKTEEQPAPMIPSQPKKDGITAISGNMRTNDPAPKPLSKTGKPTTKTIPKPAPKAAPKPLPKESNLQKPIEEMTPEELAAHNKDAEERSKRNYAAMPSNLVPHPSPAQLEMLYTNQVSQNPAPGSAVARMTDLINGRT